MIDPVKLARVVKLVEVPDKPFIGERGEKVVQVEFSTPEAARNALSVFLREPRKQNWTAVLHLENERKVFFEWKDGDLCVFCP